MTITYRDYLADLNAKLDQIFKMYLENPTPQHYAWLSASIEEIYFIITEKMDNKTDLNEVLVNRPD